LDIDELLERLCAFTFREPFDPAGNPRDAAERAISDVYYHRGWEIKEPMFIKGAEARLYFDASCAPAIVDADAIDAINADLSAEEWVTSGTKNFFKGRDTTGWVRAEDDRVRLSYTGPSQYFASQFMPAVLRAVAFQPPAELLAKRQAEGRRDLARLTNPPLWFKIVGRPSPRDLEPPDNLRSTVRGVKLLFAVLRVLNHFH